MTTMIERVARAVEDQLDVQEALLADPLTLKRIKARRIVRAAMTELRNPTDAMVDAGWDARRGKSATHIERIWHGMIDAALSEKPA